MAAFREYVGDQGGGRGLAVGAGYRQAGLAVGELSEHTGAFDYPVPLFTGAGKLPEAVRYGGRIYHERIADVGREARRVIFVMHLNTFCLK